jgi:hypothetical protein
MTPLRLTLAGWGPDGVTPLVSGRDRSLAAGSTLRVGAVPSGYRTSDTRLIPAIVVMRGNR